MSRIPAVIKNYKPRVIDRYLHVTQNGYAGVVRYHYRKSFGPKAIFVHIQEGTNWGSWQHFHVVKASSTVLIGKNGDIWNLVPPDLAPWTNGDVNQPDQVAIALMNRYGWDPNSWSLTIENEGYSGGLPYTEAQFKSNVWQISQWLEMYPTIETVHILRHGQVNSVTRSRCPEGPPYQFMAMIHAAFRGEQASLPPGTTPTEIYRPAWPVEINGKPWDGTKDVTTSTGIKFYADKRTVEVSVAALNCRQWASSLANLTREPLVKGDKVEVLGWCEGEEVDGERRWWVTKWGTRLWSGGTVQKPEKDAPIPVEPNDGVSKPDQGNNRDLVPIVLNGNTYYPVEQHGDDFGQVMEFITAGNVRLWAGTHPGSRVVRTEPKGAKVIVTHWVKGEKVTQSIPNAAGKLESVTTDKWYVIAEGKTPIQTGGRIWAGMVKEV